MSNSVPNKLFVFIYCLAIVDAKINARFTKLECEIYAPELFLNFTCYLRPSSFDGALAMYTHFKLSRDVSNITNEFKFNVKRGRNVDTYISIVVDICHALGQMHDNYFMKMVAEEIHRISNFPLKCPFRKNVDYYLNDYQIDTRVIPSYVPDISFVSDSLFFINGNQKVLHFVNYGRIDRSRASKKPKANKI